MNISSLSLNTNILSLGNLLGSNGSQELIQGINSRAGTVNFFSNLEMDPFRNGFQNFMTQVVAPIREVGMVLQQTANKLFNKDVIRPITSVEELKKGIPPCMVEPIIYYAPIRQMLEEERIDGFGIDPKTLNEEDPYESVLASGYVDEIHSTTLNKEGIVEMSFTEKSTDPELSHDDIDALRDTRKFIDAFMKDKKTAHMDFTNYPSLHA